MLNPITNSTSPAIFPWRPSAWLQARGPDAAIFLQGQFTNDLLRGDAAYGLWLNVKGKVLADSFVLRRAAPGEFWIGSYFSPAAVIKDRLESHIIADDVTIEDVTAEWTGITLFGAAAAALLAEPPREGVVFRGRRGRDESAEWVCPVADAAAMRARWAGSGELAAEEMARRRIEAGIPAVPFDAGPADLPNEAGLEGDAISYTKGCYLGQEVMARLKSMGQVRRRLLRVRGGGENPSPLPAALFAGARQVGELRSAAPDGAGGFIGLAMLSLLQLRPGMALARSADAEPTVQLVDAP